MTRHDFFKLAIESLLPADVPTIGSSIEPARSRISRRCVVTSQPSARAKPKCWPLSNAWNSTRISRKPLRMCVVPVGAGGSLRPPAAAGTSACLLAAAGVEFEVHANPGQFVEGQGLLMEMPTNSQVWSPTLGVDKKGVCVASWTKGERWPSPGRLPRCRTGAVVPGDLRFARAILPMSCAASGCRFTQRDVV